MAGIARHHYPSCVDLRNGPRPGMSAAEDRLSATWVFRSPLMQFFLRRVRSREDAEDLTQDVFLRLAGRSNGARIENNAAFVFTVAANLLRDHLRRRGSRPPFVSSADGDSHQRFAFEREMREDRNSERVLLGKESLREALTALDELGERTREIFVLFRLEKMKQRDIASLYGITVSAVEKHVAKALAHLTARCERR